MGKIERIQVSPEDREQLVRLVRDRNTAQKIVWRSQIVLLAGEGIGAVEVAARVGKSVLTVRRWRRRYAAKGVDGLLKDATRPPGRKPLTARKIKQVVNLTLNEKPPDATHWSERTMAARAGIAPSSVHKIWAAHGLKPHLTKTFKLSRDPNFVAKVEEIVGLYLNPPDKALVLAVDEKSQIQALDRTQPGLPMKKGRCGTMTHDYKRNGTTTLFAALNMLDGTVIGQCMPRHRHREFLRFLKTIDERTLPNLELHLIVDNYATHNPRYSAGSSGIRAFICTSRPLPAHGSTWSSDSLPRSPESASAAASSRASTNSSKPSWTLSITTMAIPNPTSGPRLPPKSSLKSPVRNKRWNHNTSPCRPARVGAANSRVVSGRLS